MRIINTKIITEQVKKLCIESNNKLPNDIVKALDNAYINETSNIAKKAISTIIKNIDVSKELSVPLCQDTGMAIIFAEIGQNVFLEGDNINIAINDGVAQGYLEGFLRCSVVQDPFDRVNTKNNMPAIIHSTIVEGDSIKITVAPKGFGSENMSAIKMFNPSATRDDIINFVLDVVKKAGSNPCPPIVIGVGIGGNFEYSAYLAKKSLLNRIDIPNSDKFYDNLENDILEAVNKTEIGAQGFGGNSTALAVNILHAPCHIAGLPVAVNICCHVLRHASAII